MNKNKNEYLAVDIPQGGSSYPFFLVKLEFEMFVIQVDWKLEDPEKNPSCKDKNWQQTQPSCDLVQELNLSHSGKKQVFPSPLSYPCSPK